MNPYIDFNLVHDLHHASQKVPILGPRLFEEVNNLYFYGKAYVKAVDRIIVFNEIDSIPGGKLNFDLVRRRDLLN
jgi:hypothetical protein